MIASRAPEAVYLSARTSIILKCTLLGQSIGAGGGPSRLLLQRLSVHVGGRHEPQGMQIFLLAWVAHRSQPNKARDVRS